MGYKQQRKGYGKLSKKTKVRGVILCIFVKTNPILSFVSIFFFLPSPMSQHEKTLAQYRQIIQTCQQIFEQKNKDYGTSWRILRLPSITDQIFIKAQRIRNIQERGQQLVEDSIATEFAGIVNYCVMALIQIQLAQDSRLELPLKELSELYTQQVERNIQLLHKKNHDYGEAWRIMRISSITDIILMKLLRTKRIEDNLGKTLVSEGVEANYRDILNYAVFSLILLTQREMKNLKTEPTSVS
jgi:hypothetical protein